MLTLTVLGCAGSSYDPDLRQPCSSYLLETAQVAVMLDCGFGSFSSYLGNARTTPLDALFISHAHRDHSIDLKTFVTFASAWRERPRVIASLATIRALPFNIESTEAEVIVVDDGSEIDLDLVRIECSATTHQMATLGTRVSMGGSRVVYSSDTGPQWSPPTAFLQPDMALLECTLEVRTMTSSPFHLDAEEAAALAQVLDARTTLITHVPPGENGQVRLKIAERAMPEREFLLAATGQRLLVESSSETDDYK
jgi:ribonuclease BN (tRNA processing enzyme)